MSISYHTPENTQPHRRKKKFPPAKPGYKFCYGCDEELLLSAFSVKNGRPYSQCVECVRKRDRARSKPIVRERRKTQRRSPKSTKPGYRICGACLNEQLFDQYHHRNGKPEGLCYTCLRKADRERSLLRRTSQDSRAPKARRINHKTCNTCWEEKPYPQFSKDPAQRDGYKGRCIECCAKRWEDRSPEEKRQERERRRQLGEAKRAATSAYNKRKDEVAPHRLDDYKRKRHAIVNGVYVEKVNYQRILERDGYFCYICSQPITLYQKIAFDHRVPLIPRKGEPCGSHTEDNIFVSHFQCNSRKSNRRFEDLTSFDKRGPDKL